MFDNQRTNLAKNGEVLITEHSTEFEVKKTPFESTKIVLVVFGSVLPVILIKMD